MVSFSSKRKAKESNRKAVSAYAFVVFGFVGVLFRLLSGVNILPSDIGLFYQFAVYLFGFGMTAGFLGYHFPKTMKWILIFIPFPGIDS